MRRGGFTRRGGSRRITSDLMGVRGILNSFLFHERAGLQSQILGFVRWQRSQNYFFLQGAWCSLGDKICREGSPINMGSASM